MIPNEKFQSYFPDVKLPEELPLAYRSCCLKIGSCIIIQKILNEYKLIPMLKKRFGSDTGLILDLVSYLIIEEENAGQYYPDFAFTHPLLTDKMTIYSDSKVSRLLNTISKDQCIGFLDDWNAKRDHKSRVYVSYDSTNKNSEAGDIDIVEFGKAKDDKDFQYSIYQSPWIEQTGFHSFMKSIRVLLQMYPSSPLWLIRSWSTDISR